MSRGPYRELTRVFVKNPLRQFPPLPPPSPVQPPSRALSVASLSPFDELLGPVYFPLVNHFSVEFPLYLPLAIQLLKQGYSLLCLRYFFFWGIIPSIQWSHSVGV